MKLPCAASAIVLMCYLAQPTGSDLPYGKQPAQELRMVSLGLRVDQAPSFSSIPGDATALNNQAWLLLAKGQLSEAEALLRRALDLDPSHAPALCNYGRLKQQSGVNTDQAANMFLKARQLMPQNAHVLSSCALFMEEVLHDVDKATRIYEEGLELMPSEHLLLNNFAQMLRTAGRDHERCVKLFEQALRCHPSSAESRNGLMLVLSSANRTAEAEAHLSSALELHPQETHTLCVAAQVKLQSDDINAASSLFRQALVADPANIAAAQNCAHLLSLSKQHDAAIECLESALSLQPSHPALLHSLSQIIHDQGDSFQALQLLADAHAASPSDPDVAVDLSTSLVAAHERQLSADPIILPQHLPRDPLDAAEAVLKTAWESNPRSIEVAMSLGQLFAGVRRDVAEGVRFYARAAGIDVNHTAAALSLARSLMALEQHDSAVRVLERQALLHPRDVEVLGTMGRAMAMANYEDAQEVLEMALDSDPADMTALSAYALVLKNQKQDYQGALAAYRRILRISPGDGATLTNLGWLHEEWMDDWDTAIDYYRQAWLADPGSGARPLYNRARIYDEELQNLPAAIDFYTDAGLHSEASDPFLAAESYCRAAHIHAVAYNRTARSFELYRRAYVVQPAHPGAARGIGAAYAANGELGAAIKLYEEAVKVAPNNEVARGELADLYQAMNRVDDAEQAYLTVLEREPEDVHALRGYSHLLRTHRQNPALAAQVRMKAREVEEREEEEQRRLEEAFQDLKQNRKKTVTVRQSTEDGDVVREEEVSVHHSD